MFVRNVLLAVGVLSLLGGLFLAVIWLRQAGSPPPEQTSVARHAILVANRAIPVGTLLRPEDIARKEVAPGDVHVGFIAAGQSTDTELIGAITRRDFSSGEPFIASDLVRPNERQFLAAALRPGMRAVSFAVDAPQSAAGLVLPGDQVDVILAQSFSEGTVDQNHRSVAETVLRDVRVIAIDQTLSAPVRVAAASPRPTAVAADARMPRTVTFEVTEKQAERLIVAAQLGRLQLSVRPLQITPAGAREPRGEAQPTWAAEVSPALNELTRRKPQAAGGIESTIRRPPASGDAP